MPDIRIAGEKIVNAPVSIAVCTAFLGLDIPDGELTYNLK